MEYDPTRLDHSSLDLLRRFSRRRLLAAFVVSATAPSFLSCAANVTPNPTPASTSAPPTMAPATVTPLSPTTIPPTAIPTPTPAPTDPPTVVPTPSPNPSPTRAVPTPAPDRLQPNGPPHDPGPLDWAKPGPYLGLLPDNAGFTTFSSRQPLIATYYFYWFDLTDPSRREPDWKLHPPDPDHYSFLSAAWHRRQLADMQAAGIDVALAVY